jgi:hypothetical protein
MYRVHGPAFGREFISLGTPGIVEEPVLRLAN